jgi:glycosyltransferase involved in cell wall biosynthesis
LHRRVGALKVSQSLILFFVMTHRKKILVINTHPDRSEAFMIGQLAGRGYDAEVILHPGAVRRSAIESAGLPVYPLSIKQRLQPSLIRLIRERVASGAQLIHCFNKRSLSNAVFALRRTEVPIVTYRGVIGNLWQWNPETRLTFFNPRVKKIICVCDAVRDYMESIGIKSHKLLRIHKGHRLDWYTPAARSALGEFGIPEAAFVVGCTARIRARKGLDVLMEAAKRLSDQPVHFLLVGEITDGRVRQMAGDPAVRNRVHLAGFRTDAAALMGACDAFVMPSLRREGLPRAVIEAMAQGVPAIVTDVGGMPEIVVDGENGLVIKPGESDSLAAAILKLSADAQLKKRMGAEARKRIATAFNVETTITQTAAVYDEVLSS